MILHIDMDAFYAAVEERENPELKGKPLVVGGQALYRKVSQQIRAIFYRYTPIIEPLSLERRKRVKS